MKRKNRLTLESYLSLTWWGLLVSSVGVVYTSELVATGVVWETLLAGALTLNPLGSRRFRSMQSTRWFLFPSLAILLHGVWVFTAERDIVGLIAQSLCAILPLFLLRKEKALGYWVSLWILFLLALTGLVIDGELEEYIFFLLHLTILVFNLNAGNLVFIGGSGMARYYRLPKNYFAQFSVAMVWGVVVGVSIFLFFPRHITWQNPWGISRHKKTTGFSETVELDGSRELAQSATVNLRIEADDPEVLAAQASTIFLRGKSLDYFDGTKWESTTRPGMAYRPSKHQFVGEARLHLTIFREPLASAVLFIPEGTERLEFPIQARSVSQDEGGAVYISQSEFLRYSYGAYTRRVTYRSEIASRELKKSEATNGLSGSERMRYLQIPESLEDAPFFQEWVSSVKKKAERKTYHDLTRALQREFKSRFKATLIHEFKGKTPFEYFLTKGREGHCEYFASAATLFYRTLGIPARVVVGYRGGTFNTVSQVLEVKEQNAHAWIEIYLPDTGWQIIDPTPPIAAATASSWPFLEWLALGRNAADFWLNRYVVHYNRTTQRDLLNRFSSITKQKEWSANLRNHIRWKWIIAFTGLLIIVAILRRWRRVRLASRDYFPRYYENVIKIAARKGYTRNIGETHSAFLSRLVALGVKEDWISHATEALEKDLYGVSGTSPQERLNLTRELKQAARYLTRKSSASG